MESCGKCISLHIESIQQMLLDACCVVLFSLMKKREEKINGPVNGSSSQFKFLKRKAKFKSWRFDAKRSWKILEL